MQIKL